MSLTADTVKKTAHLASLTIADEAIETIQTELNNILHFIEKLQSLDTSDTPALAHSLDMSQAFRPDQTTEQNNRQLLQSIAPSTDAGFYLVPAVIDSPTDYE